MKKRAIVIQCAFALIALGLSSLQAGQGHQEAQRLATINLLHEYINHATPTDMPMESRVAAGVEAASELAKAIGYTTALSDLQQAAYDPPVGFPTSETTYDWGTDQWDPLSRTVYTYTGENQATILYQHWDGFGWVNDYRFSYAYDGEGRLFVYTYQAWQDGAWVNQYRYTLTYSGSGDPIESLTEYWVSSAWTGFSKTLTTYDGSHRIDYFIVQTWVVNTWVNSLRTSNTYNGNGDYTLILTETWLGTWMNQSQTMYYYDGSHRLTSSVTQMWPGAGWVNTNMEEYEYDGSDNETLHRASTWNSTDWMVTDVDTMKYNGSNQLVESVDWYIQGSYLSKDNYSYNGDGTVSEVITSSWHDSMWRNETKVVWEYGTLATAIESDLLPRDFTLMQNYPNPFNPTTTIRYALARPQQVLIEVRNVLGQVVQVLEDERQSAGVYETTWDGRDSGGHEVASGVYFYHLKAGEFSETRKMLLMR